MLRTILKLPRPPVDLVLAAGAFLLAVAGGWAMSSTIQDRWVEVFFLGAVTLFLVETVRFLVHAFDIQDEVDELQAVHSGGPNEADRAEK